jgi:uncharacterized protein YjiS (DUF1127 family)
MMTIETISPADAADLSLVRRALSFLRNMRRNRRTRLHLADLSDAALEDIGLSRREAEAEARRWIWP